MTKEEEKDLILQDLCARLPYAIIGLYSWKNREPYNRELTGNLYDELKSSWNSTEDSKFLPYLRPLSSMTEEEKLEFSLVPIYAFVHYNEIAKIDWLNAHHFDYRGLIDRGFAIEVTEDNNPYKDKD